MSGRRGGPLSTCLRGFPCPFVWRGVSCLVSWGKGCVRLRQWGLSSLSGAVFLSVSPSTVSVSLSLCREDGRVLLRAVPHLPLPPLFLLFYYSILGWYGRMTNE